MANFAELDENNIVTRVIVIGNEDITDENGIEREELGIQYCQNLLGSHTRWKQTSYNKRIRKNYAGIGHYYDEELDVFIPPKPFESWILNEETANWESPIGPPPELTQEQMQNGLFYRWDEETQTWIDDSFCPTCY